MRLSRGRRGVASVIGTVLFAVVFMVALGAMAYMSGLEAQSAAAEQQAQQAAARRGSELLTFSSAPSGLTVADAGPTSAVINHIILRFPNGTAYSLPASAALPTGGRASVQGLLPAGVCSPGTATCLSKYEQIASGNPRGSSLGVVTSMGNAFWYTYSAPAIGGAVLSARVLSDTTTTGSGVYSSTTLAVALAPNANYVFYGFTSIEPSLGIEHYNFEIHALPTGATLVIACTPLSYPSGGGNQPTNCVSTAGIPIAPYGTLGFGVAPPVFQTPGLFGMVTMGESGGVLQIDMACVSNCGGVTIKAGSFMLVYQVP